MKKIQIESKNAWKWAILIIIVGILVRLVNFGNAPGGLNVDEAFSGYETYSLLNYGVDAEGYHNPCYFVAWGGGMNALQGYLGIPFMKLLGVSEIAVRLPQLILACISLFVFYLLMKKIFSYKTALLGLSLLVISPWHIMLSRWALESNLAPAFLLLGLYFLIKGINNNKFLIFSAISYGLALYAYSITWLVVPITLLICGIYIIKSKQKISLKYIVISCIILFLFALPLILFLLVNKGIIPEIRTSIFSVPKLVSMRSGEASIINLILPNTYKSFFNVFVIQRDGLIWNAIPMFGMFYKTSIPFIFIGLVKLIKTSISKAKKKEFCYETIILIGMLCSVFVCLLISYLNINKANCLHFYTLILITLGIKEFFAVCKGSIAIRRVIFGSYIALFAYFCIFYFGYYNTQMSNIFCNGLEEAVNYVKEQEYDEICVDLDILYSQILFYDKTPVDEFKDTVEYYNYPAQYLKPKKFGNYRFGIDYNNLDLYNVYIIPRDIEGRFINNGYEIIEFESCAVAYKGE